MEGKVDCERRAFLKTATLVGTAAVVSGVPLATYVVSPSLQKGVGTWLDFGAVENLEPGSMKMLSYEFMVKEGWVVLPRQGFVWARTAANSTLTIFSPVCPHLSCTISWQEEAKVFECPCHSGRFDAAGRPMAGPPSKPLAVLAHKVENGNLLVLLPS